MAKDDLTSGSVFKTLIKYAAPMVTTSLFQAVYSIIDIIIAGEYIGGRGISGISNGSLLMNLITEIAIGITVGGNVLISQYFGSHQDENQKEAIGTLFAVSILMSILFGFGFYFSANALLTFLNAPALEEAVIYVQICSVGMMFIFGYNALSAILRALGNSKKPMQIIIISTVINIILDIVFVAVLKIGVAGTAPGTIISQFISFVLAFIYLSRRGEEYGFLKEYLRIKKDKLIKILKLGLPLAFQWAIVSISWIGVAYFINKYGVDVSAGNGISNKIKNFCQLFITAMTSAAATMAAQCLGAKKFERAKEIQRCCMKVTVSLALLIIIFVEFAAPAIVSIFNKDPMIAVHAVRNIRIEIIAQLFFAIFLTYNVLATASGDTGFVMANSFLNCIPVRLILVIVLERFIGVDGVYIACMIAPLASVPVGKIYCVKEKWKKSLV